MTRQPYVSKTGIFLVYLHYYLFVGAVLACLKFFDYPLKVLPKPDPLQTISSNILLTIILIIISIVIFLIIRNLSLKVIRCFSQRYSGFPFKYTGSPEKVQISFWEIIPIPITLVGFLSGFDISVFYYICIYILLVILHFTLTNDTYSAIYLIMGYRGYKANDPNGAPTMIILTKGELLNSKKTYQVIKLTATIYLRKEA